MRSGNRQRSPSVLTSATPLASNTPPARGPEDPERRGGLLNTIPQPQHPVKPTANHKRKHPASPGPRRPQATGSITHTIPRARPPSNRQPEPKSKSPPARGLKPRATGSITQTIPPPPPALSNRPASPQHKIPRQLGTPKAQNGGEDCSTPYHNPQHPVKPTTRPQHKTPPPARSPEDPERRGGLAPATTQSAPCQTNHTPPT